MDEPSKSVVLLLLSGGIDSTALLHFYLKRSEVPKCVHFNYNQPNSKSEASSVEAITNHYGTELISIDLKIPMAYRGDEVLCRNALFVLAAASLGYTNSRIALGIHANSTYYDASKIFLPDIQKILDGYFSGSTRIEAPFMDYSKADIIEYCTKFEVPIELTYSCFRQNAPPCGECPSCLDRVNSVEN